MPQARGFATLVVATFSKLNTVRLCRSCASASGPPRQTAPRSQTYNGDFKQMPYDYREKATKPRLSRTRIQQPGRVSRGARHCVTGNKTTIVESHPNSIGSESPRMAIGHSHTADSHNCRAHSGSAWTGSAVVAESSVPCAQNKSLKRINAPPKALAGETDPRWLKPGQRSLRSLGCLTASRHQLAACESLAPSQRSRPAFVVNQTCFALFSNGMRKLSPFVTRRLLLLQGAQNKWLLLHE